MAAELLKIICNGIVNTIDVPIVFVLNLYIIFLLLIYYLIVN